MFAATGDYATYKLASRVGGGEVGWTAVCAFRNPGGEVGLIRDRVDGWAGSVVVPLPRQRLPLVLRDADVRE